MHSTSGEVERENSPHINGTLERISQIGNIKVAPKSLETVSVYLKRGEEEFQAKKIEVSDSTGKKWIKSI